MGTEAGFRREICLAIWAGQEGQQASAHQEISLAALLRAAHGGAFAASTVWRCLHRYSTAGGKKGAQASRRCLRWPFDRPRSPGSSARSRPFTEPVQGKRGDHSFG